MTGDDTKTTAEAIAEYLQRRGLKIGYGNERQLIATRMAHQGCTIDDLERIDAYCASTTRGNEEWARGMLWKMCEENGRWQAVIADLDATNIGGPSCTGESDAEVETPKGHCVHGKTHAEHCCACSSAEVCRACDPDEARRHFARRKRRARAEAKAAGKEAKPKPRHEATDDPLARKKLLWFRRERLSHDLDDAELAELNGWEPDYVTQGGD